MPGSPDWQAYPQQVGDAFQYGVVVSNVGQDVDTIAVSQWAGLDIYGYHPTQDTELTLTWITTTPTGNSVWEEIFTFQANVESHYHAANHGAFVKANVIAPALGGTLNLRLTPHNRPLDYQSGDEYGYLVQRYNVSLAAGATATDVAFPYRGPVAWTYSTGAAASNFQIIAQDFTGANKLRLVQVANVGDASGIIYVPSLKIST